MRIELNRPRPELAGAFRFARWLTPGRAEAGGLRRGPILASLPLILLGTLAGCGGDREAATPPSRDVRAVTTVAPARTVPQYVFATGGLEAAKTVHVSTRMMGWVRKIHVEEGQAVTAGDPLISIDDTDLRAKMAQVEAGIAEARAVLANAERMVVRFEKLYAENSVSKQQLDDVVTGRDRARAGITAAQAMRDEVEVHLSYVEITAPMAGIVARKKIEEGNMANPGLPLLVLEQNDRMKVVARLGEKDVSSVTAGDSVRVDVTSLADARFAVPLARVIPTANPGSRTYDIEAYLPNPTGRLKSGMFARVSVPIGERQAVVVPAESIISRGQLRGVFVVDGEGLARLRWIRLGHPLAGGVEVLSGLEGGETIVVSAEQPLIEGDRVVR